MDELEGKLWQPEIELLPNPPKVLSLSRRPFSNSTIPKEHVPL